MLPEADASVIDTELEQRMEHAIRIVGLVRAIRVKSNLKVRQPLKKIILPVTREEDRRLIQRMADVILEEINVKQIEFVTDDSGIVRKKAKPNFRSLGQKFGKNVQPVAARIREFTPAEITTLEKQGSISLPINGSDTTIVKEDVEILHEDIEGWLVESDGTLTVALDTELDEELIDEGYAREFVNRVQNMRKDAGFEVTDRIRIFYRAGERLTKALARLTVYIRQETLATDVISSPPPELLLTEADINGEQIFLAIEKSIDS
jgi:isoleucyl-tRNA synthetase